MAQRGEGMNEVLSTQTVSCENKSGLRPDLLKPARRKKEQLIHICRTRVTFKPTAGRTNAKGKAVGGTQFSMHTILNGFVRFSMPGNSSLARLGATPALVAFGSNITVQPEGRSGCRTRRQLPPGSKPINATGATSEQTISREIRAVQLAIDRMIVETRMVEQADVVHLQVDSSTFGDFSMQAVMLTLLTIVWDTMDALGTPLYHITKRSKFLESIPCADHKTLDQEEAGAGNDQQQAKGKKFYRKEASFNFGMVCIMAGIAFTLLHHACVVIGLDRGPEAVGSGKGKRWAAMRDAFAGRGGFLEQMWGTREALAQPMASLHGHFLKELMGFLGVPKAEQEFEERPLPDTMDISSPVLRVPMTFVEYVQDPVTKGISKKETLLNEENPRVSTVRHPLAKLPLFDGGSADAEWCEKHAFSTAVKKTTNPIKKFFQDVMRIIRLVRNHWIWMHLRAFASAIIGVEGSRECDEVDLALKEALGEERLKQILLNNPTGLKLPVEACETRWAGLTGGASQLFGNLLFFAAMFPLVFAEGSRDNKIEAMKATCSKGGFVDKKLIAYSNPKIGRAVFYMSQPYFILDLAILDFLQKNCWQPSLVATSHRKDCAMAQTRGLGSILRVIIWVLTRGIWVSSAIQKRKDKKIVSNQRPWNIFYKLGHRGPIGAKLNGRCNTLLLLSARLEDDRAWRVRNEADSTKCVGDLANGYTGISPLRHLYGELYTNSMKTAVKYLQSAINSVAQMTLVQDPTFGPLDILPPRERDAYKKHVKRPLSEPSSFAFRVQLAMWLVHQRTTAAVVALTEKSKFTMNDPAGFAVGALGVDAHRLIGGSLELDQGMVLQFFTASVLARANAAILWLQCREVLAHNQSVAQYLQPWLKPLYSEPIMHELRKFSWGVSVVKDLESRGQLMSDEGTEVKPDPSTLFYPINRFRKSARVCLMASARPTNNNQIESMWSILTGKYMSGMRRAQAQCWSMYSRKLDYAIIMVHSR